MCKDKIIEKSKREKTITILSQSTKIVMWEIYGIYQNI